MIATLIEGILFGLLIAITPGPIFFTIIQTGINRGFKGGLFTALGVLLSDLTLIAICYLGISSIIETLNNKMHVGLIGGIILIIMGTVTFTRKPDKLRKRNQKYASDEPKIYSYILKGFFINLSNPALIIFWLSAVSWISSRAEPSRLFQYVAIFFTGTLMTIFSTDLLKSFIGIKIKHYLSLRIQLWINRIVGLILAGSGILLIFEMVWPYLSNRL